MVTSLPEHQMTTFRASCRILSATETTAMCLATRTVEGIIYLAVFIPGRTATSFVCPERKPNIKAINPVDFVLKRWSICLIWPSKGRSRYSGWRGFVSMRIFMGGSPKQDALNRLGRSNFEKLADSALGLQLFISFDLQPANDHDGDADRQDFYYHGPDGCS